MVAPSASRHTHVQGSNGSFRGVRSPGGAGPARWREEAESAGSRRAAAGQGGGSAGTAGGSEPGAGLAHPGRTGQAEDRACHHFPGSQKSRLR